MSNCVVDAFSAAPAAAGEPVNVSIQGSDGHDLVHFSAYHDQTMGTLPTPNPKRHLAALMINTLVGASSNPDTSYTRVFDASFAHTSTGNVYEDNGHPVRVRSND